MSRNLAIVIGAIACTLVAVAVVAIPNYSSYIQRVELINAPDANYSGTIRVVGGTEAKATRSVENPLKVAGEDYTTNCQPTDAGDSGFACVRPLKVDSSGSIYGVVSPAAGSIFDIAPKDGGVFVSSPAPGAIFDVAPRDGGVFVARPAPGAVYDVAPADGGIFVCSVNNQPTTMGVSPNAGAIFDVAPKDGGVWVTSGSSTVSPAAGAIFDVSARDGGVFSVNPAAVTASHGIEVLVLNSAAVRVPDVACDGGVCLAGRRGMECCNNGPNSIWCDQSGNDAVLTKARPVATGTCFAVSCSETACPVSCRASTADQVTGGGTWCAEAK